MPTNSVASGVAVAPTVGGASVLAAALTEALLTGPAAVVVEPPGDSHGFWAGGPSAVLADGVHYLAYRLRRPADQGRGYANVLARSTDGVTFTVVATVLNAGFGAASLERPALVQRPDGGWRLYVSCSTPGSKHWWVEALDADTVAGLAAGERTMVLAGDARSAWKDVVVRRDGTSWRMWACRHLLDDGDDNADRMQSWSFTSADGLTWDDGEPALLPTPDSWNRRGTRITSVLPVSRDGWLALYDGRASAAENWYERTGIALGAGPDRFTGAAGPLQRAGRTLRYVSAVEAPGGYRLYFEIDRADGANQLVTTWVPFPR